MQFVKNSIIYIGVSQPCSSSAPHTHFEIFLQQLPSGSIECIHLRNLPKQGDSKQASSESVKDSQEQTHDQSKDRYEEESRPALS